MTGLIGPTKEEIRARVSVARRAMSPRDRASAASSITRLVLDLVDSLSAEDAPTPTVAGYVSIGTEPATAEVLEALLSHGARVLAPVLDDDLDLDWAAYDGPTHLAPGPRGLRSPTGPRLGREAIAAADLVLVPALAVDERGTRLGRGGGSYDRALARVPAGRTVVALLYDGELLPVAPAEPHDRPVTAVITPAGLRRLA